MHFGYCNGIEKTFGSKICGHPKYIYAEIMFLRTVVSSFRKDFRICRKPKIRCFYLRNFNWFQESFRSFLIENRESFTPGVFVSNAYLKIYSNF